MSYKYDTMKKMTVTQQRGHISLAHKRATPKNQWTHIQPNHGSFESFHFEQESRPFAQTNKDVSLQCLLKALTKKQLVDLIVFRLVANGKSAERKLRSELPMPDVESLLEDLELAKRSIFRSMPQTRFARTDSVAYERAAHAISQMKAKLSEHASQLYDSENWDALVDYVLKAWDIVHEMPLWDSIMHNGTRGECFKILTTNCIAAVSNAGMRLGPVRLSRLERRIPEWSKDFPDMHKCMLVINRVVNKATSRMR